MSSINIKGVLRNPNSDVSFGNLLRLTHVTTTGETVAGFGSSDPISINGAYDIDIEYGNVFIETFDKVSAKWKSHGVRTINSETPATTLTELIGVTTPLSDPELLIVQNLVADAQTAKNEAEQAKDKAESAVSMGEAVILWTGQSNSVQVWTNSDSPDEISDKAQIWNGSEWVQLAAGVGDIQANATNHSLFNYTKKLIDEGFYSSCKIITAAVVGRPIQDWVGTPEDRTISKENTPIMQDILDQALASSVDKFTHVVTIQGEANFYQDPLPFFIDGTYGYDRVLLGDIIIDNGLADDDTKWFEVELLPPNVAFVSWKQNAVINLMNTIGRPNVYVIPTSDFLGYDEGLSTVVSGLSPTTMDYTIHFKPEENSELGNRLFYAEKGVNLDGGQYQKMSSGPDGHQGYIRPYLAVTDETVSLSSYWAVGGLIFVSGVCDITLLRDAVRGGQKYNSGMEIAFYLNTGSELTLNTEDFKIKDGLSNRGSSNTIFREGSANGSNVIKLVFNGSRWDLLEDQEYRGSEGAFVWYFSKGRLEVVGSAILGNSQGDSVLVAFPDGMPALNTGSYFVFPDGAAVASSLTTDGFTLIRAASVTSTGGLVRFLIRDAQVMGF